MLGAIKIRLADFRDFDYPAQFFQANVWPARLGRLFAKFDCPSLADYLARLGIVLMVSGAGRAFAGLAFGAPFYYLAIIVLIYA